MARADIDTKLVAEDNIFRNLRGAGWQGNVQQLRLLAHKGEELRRRWEAACNYSWAAEGSRYDKRTDELAQELGKLADRFGLCCFLQGDCRGNPIYVSTEPLTDTDYTRGFALYWGS